MAQESEAQRSKESSEVKGVRSSKSGKLRTVAAGLALGATSHYMASVEPQRSLSVPPFQKRAL